MTTIRIDDVTDYEHCEPEGRAVVENRHSFGKIHVWRNTGRGELYAGFLLWSTDHIAHATPTIAPKPTMTIAAISRRCPTSNRGTVFTAASNVSGRLGGFSQGGFGSRQCSVGIMHVSGTTLCDP